MAEPTSYNQGWLNDILLGMDDFRDDGNVDSRNSGLLLELYHGRNDPNEDLDDWGAEGPVFGPLEYVHITYASTISFSYVKQHHHKDYHRWKEFENCFLNVEIGGLVYYDKVYYGDWTVVAVHRRHIENLITSTKQKFSRFQDFDELKATLPPKPTTSNPAP